MLIVVEGCVGAGKTTVASGLAKYRGARTIFEDFECNPFLQEFYEDPVAHAVETEFTFLLLHFHQLKNVRAMASRENYIADFDLRKDLLYADLNFTDPKTRWLFGELYEVLAEQTPLPSLMICLSASTELLIKRIRQRNRKFEMAIDPSYYGKINAMYQEFFAEYKGRKLHISMDEWDFVLMPQLFENLSLLIDHTLETQ